MVVLISLPNVKDHRTVIIAFLRVGVGAKLHLSRGPMHPLVGLILNFWQGIREI
jgi:hypothetical protein